MQKQLAVVETSNVVTEFLKTMIKLSDDPRQVVVGIHNTFVFGEIFEEIGFDITEEELTQIFDGIEAIGKALDKDVVME